MDQTATNASADSARLPVTTQPEVLIPDYSPDEAQWLGSLQKMLENARNLRDTNHDEYDGMTYIEQWQAEEKAARLVAATPQRCRLQLSHSGRDRESIPPITHPSPPSLTMAAFSLDNSAFRAEYNALNDPQRVRRSGRTGNVYSWIQTRPKVSYFLASNEGWIKPRNSQRCRAIESSRSDSCQFFHIGDIPRTAWFRSSALVERSSLQEHSQRDG